MTPTFETFMLPYLQGLSDGQTHTNADMAEYCAKALNLSKEDKAEKTKKGTAYRYYDRSQWAGTYLRQAGLAQSCGYGKTSITQAGKDLLAQNPSHIGRELLTKYPLFRDFQSRTKKSKDEGEITYKCEAAMKTPQERIDEAFSEISSNLADELLSAIKKQSPQFFEHLVVKLLVAMGYGGSLEDAASVTQYSHDEGIDGIIKEDKLGLDNIYVQAKRYDTGIVGRKEIQSFVGALSGKGATKGIFITTSSFTKDAKEYKPASNIKIVLIDGQQLSNHMIDFNIGVNTKQVYEVKRLDTDFFSED